ncbi:IclR family transcriptional regulator [Arthrobacter sp. Z1-9]
MSSPDENGAVKRDYHSQTTHRTLGVLRHLSTTKGAVSLADLARALQMPKGSLYPIVATMHADGFLNRDPASGHYSLSPMILTLCKDYLAQTDYIDEFNAVSALMTEQVDETMQMAVLNGTEVVYVARRDSTQPVRLVSNVGQRLPAHATALGKCLLSELTEQELESLYPAAQLVQVTERTISSRDELISALAKAKAVGGADDWEEIAAGLCCTAAPVRDASGRIVAAVSFSCPVPRADAAKWDLMHQKIREAAAAISQRVGFSGSHRYLNLVQ